ncbi:hypothetical protein Tco_0133203 [Tanacetum coccineum]
MKQDKVKQAARDEKLVSSNARVKIGKSNLRMDPSTKQREETYQVALDIIKNTPFFNAFLISSDVPEIYMQQFWLTIKKVNKSSSYQFVIYHKTCEIDVDIFREILDISPKGKLTQTSDVYVDQMHQPWRTFGAIINKCLSRKIMSNDRLHPYRIEILGGMYHNANVDYDALIWEDLQYQIDHRRSKVNSREFMPYPRFTKAIIHHFMTKHKSISKRKGSPYHLVDKDGMLDRLKFINKGDIYQVYGKCIPGRGIGSQEGKSTATPKEPTKPRKKPSKKKQVPRDESPESEGELENRQCPVKKSKESSGKLKGIEMLSEAAQLELATLKAIKESQRTSRLKHKTGGSSEGTGVSLGVPDELTGNLLSLMKELALRRRVRYGLTTIPSLY